MFTEIYHLYDTFAVKETGHKMISLAIDDHIPFIKGVLEPYCRVMYGKGGLITRETALDADGLIIRTRTICDEKLLSGSKVRFIATATIGFDHIDTAYCEKHGIKWFHAPGCNANSVKQYMASVFANLSIKQEIGLYGKKIGIIGAGHVGKNIISLAECFGMIPYVNDPPRERSEGKGKFVSIKEIMNSCDIITFHVPLNREGDDPTWHLADQDFFDKLQCKPIIINTSRGPVVETNAVKDALKCGRIAGYIADVWENEPYPDLELLHMSLIATPHIAGYSVEGKANGTSVAVQAASRFFGFRGLEDWYPTLLPGPQDPVIQIDPAGKPEEKILTEAILKSYDVMVDDMLLRYDPTRFEALRNNYQMRREFESFKVKLRSPTSELLKKLDGLGYMVGSSFDG